MKIIRSLTFSLILLFSFNNLSFSQGNWTVFSKDNNPLSPKGLVSAVFEDKQNNLWVSTGFRLYMYDGNRWKRFKGKDGLKNPSVTRFFQDSKGTIWIGTKGGLSTYKDGKLTALIPKFTLKLSELAHNFPINYISCIYEDSKENIWFGTGLKISRVFGHTRGLLSKYDGEKCTNIRTKMNSHPIIDIMEDNDGYIWVSSGWDCVDCTGPNGVFVGHLAKYKDGNWYSYIDKIPYNDKWIINDIYKDKLGNLWFSALSNKNAGCVIKYDGEKMSFFTKKNGLLNYVSVYFEDSNDILWFGGPGGLAYRINDEYRFLRNKNNEIITLGVKIIKEDSKKNVWVGTTKGMYVYTSEGSWKHFTIKDGLSGSSNNIQIFGEDFEGKMWILTRGRKLKSYISKINPENWSAEPIPMDKFNLKILYNIIECSNKDLWFVSNGQLMKYSQ